MSDEAMLVEVHELAQYLNTSFDTGASLEAYEQLWAAQSELEDFLNRPVTVRTFEDVVLRVPAPSSAWHRGTVVFRDAPVVELLSLAADGTAVDLTGSSIATWGIRNYSGAVGADGTLVGSYRAGLDGKNDRALSALKTVVKRRAAREMVPRQDGTQATSRVSDEGYSEDAEAPEGGFTSAELRSVRRHKRRRTGFGR